MGIELPYHNSPIVEMGATLLLLQVLLLIQLVIDPKQILVVNDVDSFFLKQMLLVLKQMKKTL